MRRRGKSLKRFLKWDLLGFIISSVASLSLTSFEAAMESEYRAKSPNKLCSKVKKLYETSHYKLNFSKEQKIPKKLHQIWIGGPLPKKFEAYVKTWKKMHPTWDFKLWTDSDLLDFSFKICETAYRKARNIGAKADILRYEILYQFGGVYVDIDFECLRPLDDLIYAHSFFSSLGSYTYIANSVLGAKRHHRALKILLEKLRDKTEQELNNPWYQTGPFFLTRHLLRALKNSQTDYMIYPTRYFHPLPNVYRFEYREKKLTREFIKSFCISESFAIHYWAESWK